jgi:hypothetical protein
MSLDDAFQVRSSVFDRDGTLPVEREHDQTVALAVL